MARTTRTRARPAEPADPAAAVTSTIESSQSREPGPERKPPDRRLERAAAADGNAVVAESDAKDPPKPDARIDETLKAAANVLRLKAGLYVVEIEAGAPSLQSASLLPGRIWLAQIAPRAGDAAELLSEKGLGDQWIDAGHAIVVRVPASGAILTATAFGATETAVAAPRVTVRTLGEGRAAGILPSAPQATTSGAEAMMPEALLRPADVDDLRIEITAHLEGVGDRTFPGSSWIGRRGGRRRVEGFSLNPLQELRASEIEYKVLHPGGIETPWVPGPQFCGTRGQSLGVTGFAVRIAPHVQDQFSVVYQGAFFRSGVTDTRSNGAACLPSLTGDMLEALNIRVVRRRN